MADPNTWPEPWRELYHERLAIMLESGVSNAERKAALDIDRERARTEPEEW